MGLCVRVMRGLAFVCAVLGGITVFTALVSIAARDVAVAQTARSIVIEGNRRVEADTIRSYFKPGPNGQLDAIQIDEGLKALIATGLFQDVRVNSAGGRLVVTVVENPVINRVVFEGNKKAKDEQLNAEVQSKPRGTLSRPTVQADVQRIIEIYHRSGRFDVRVEPKIIELPNNRVDLVFEITEGNKTGVKSIVFVGNRAYASFRLKEEIKTVESNWLSFLQTTDIYDPDRVEADRDLLRRFYLKHGYADVRIVSAVGEYDPAKKGFTVTYTIDEGAQYHVGTVDVVSNVHAIEPASLRAKLKIGAGDVYNAEKVEKTVEGMTIEAAKRGYAFATVRPRGDRNFETKTINIVFVAEEGPRVYIERINIRGNTRTRDYVIRREFDIGEGDAYNRALMDRAERRLKNLNYFKKVKITNEPGSAPDRVVVNVDVEEQSTGQFSVSGGFSTSDGWLAEVSVGERNLLGRGQYAKATVTYGQRSRGIELSFAEPYFLGYRMGAGVDLFYKESIASTYLSYDTKTIGTNLRLGLWPDRGTFVPAALFDLPAGNLTAGAASIIVTTSIRTVAGTLSDQRGGDQIPPPDCLFIRHGLAVYSELLRRRRSEPCSAQRTGERSGADLAGRLLACLQYPGQQQESDQWRHCRAEAGFRGCWRRRQFYPHLG